MEVIVHSKEFEIDRRLEELSAKIMTESATETEREEHEQLAKQRSKLMQGVRSRRSSVFRRIA